MVNRDPHHVHTYDAQGNMTCCTLEDKINQQAAHVHHHDHEHDHDHNHGEKDSTVKLFLPAIVKPNVVRIGYRD